MDGGDITISESERDVLKVLWELDSATVREIRKQLSQQGRNWAHTTVNTLLTRLEQKGCVACNRDGFAHVYSAAVTRDELVRRGLAGLADDYCNGTRVPLMLALVDGQKFSDEEIEEFRKLVDRLEAEQPVRKPARKGKR